MGSIIPPRATISGTVAAPGITLFDVPTSGLYETASFGVGISMAGANYFTLDSTHFTVGPAPAGVFALSAATGSPFAVANTPVCFAVSPNGQFAVFGLNGATPGIEVYKINPDSSLTFLSSYNTATSPITQIAFSPDGNYVYAVEYLTSVLQYSINSSTGALTSIGNAALNNGLTGFKIKFSADGSFAYACGNDGFAPIHGHVFVYQRNNSTGAITAAPIQSIDLGLGVTVVDIAASNRGFYASHAATIYPYTRNTLTGLLTALSTVVVGSSITSLVASPDDGSLYGALQNNTVVGYSIDATSGALAALAGSPYAAALGGNGGYLAMSSDSGYCYAAGVTPNTNLLPFLRNTTTGVLTALVGFNVTAGSQGVAVVGTSNAYIYSLSGSVSIYSMQTSAVITHPLIECSLDPAGLGGTFTINGALYVGGVPMTLPSLTGNAGKFLRVNTGATGYAWDGVNTNVTVAMVGNAGAFTIEDSGNYQVELSGALTAQGAVTATLSVPTDATLVVFDNKITGGYPSILNGVWTIPLGKSIWYWNGATFEQICGTSPISQQKSGVSSGIGNSGTVAANGAITFGTALDAIYGPTGVGDGIWWYLPAGAAYAGSVAGLYWLVMTTTTTGTIYNNQYSGVGNLTPPAAPTPIVAAGPGAFVGVTTEQIMEGVSILAGILGLNGNIRHTTIWSNNNSAGNKTIRTRLGGIGGASFLATANTTAIGSYYQGHISNAGNASSQVGGPPSGILQSSAASPLTSNINTAVATTLVHTGQVAVATDWVIRRFSSIELTSDGA